MASYLILATNMGGRLGLLVTMAGLFGWMASMGIIWWSYGIGLKGREPTWKPKEIVIGRPHARPATTSPTTRRC